MLLQGVGSSAAQHREMHAALPNMRDSGKCDRRRAPRADLLL